MKHLVFIGPPGAGKGTQASFLINNHGYNHVSTGDILRKEVTSKSEIGVQVESVLAKGDLVSDELIIKILKKNLNFSTQKYIFDGFPRTNNQATYFDKSLMAGHDYVVLLFKVDLGVLFNRLTNRRVSADGKHIYNLLTSPPKKEGICDVSSLPLVQRDDDMPTVVSNRLKIYDEMTKPIVDFFAKLNRLVVIDADQDINLVKSQIVKIIS